MRKTRWHCDICGKVCRAGINSVITITSGGITLDLVVNAASESVSEIMAKDLRDVCVECVRAVMQDAKKTTHIGIMGA